MGGHQALGTNPVTVGLMPGAISRGRIVGEEARMDDGSIDCSDVRRRACRFGKIGHGTHSDAGRQHDPGEGRAWSWSRRRSPRLARQPRAPLRLVHRSRQPAAPPLRSADGIRRYSGGCPRPLRHCASDLQLPRLVRPTFSNRTLQGRWEAGGRDDALIRSARRRRRAWNPERSIRAFLPTVR